MNNNSIAITDRELVDGHIEGVNFGPRLWVIARSPAAVLIWIYGHSWSSGGRSHYAEPYLTLLPDRTPRFMHRPRYKTFQPFGRIHRDRVQLYSKEICEAFGSDALEPILQAVAKRRTVVIEGGGGALLPLKCPGWTEAYRDWRAAGGGFIVHPEGMTEHDACRHKLGWKPR